MTIKFPNLAIRKYSLSLAPFFLLVGCEQGFLQDTQPANQQSLGTELTFASRLLNDEEETLNYSNEMIDYGDPLSQHAELALGAAVPVDGKSHILGEWSAAHPWPLSPIHAALLPNGNVLTYGAKIEQIERGRAFDVDRWNPDGGFAQSAHEMTPTGIDTNMFCSAQSVLSDGNVLISGGDKKEQGVTADPTIRNEGVRSSTRYNTETHTLNELPNMTYERWYPTLVTLGSGAHLAIGGRSTKLDDDSQEVVPIVPELYRFRGNTWKVLSNARSEEYYKDTWYYPRAFLNGRGAVTMLSYDNPDIYELTIGNNGDFRKVGTLKRNSIELSHQYPAAMYQAGKVIVMAVDGSMHTIDIDSENPTSEDIAQPSGPRLWGDMTVLADGSVFLVGGSREAGSGENKLATAIHYGEIWNPELDEWQKMRESTSKKARLYHSVSLLLPDASVLVAGGGPPGPVVNMNADIFFPPYLYKADGSGAKAERPIIKSLDKLSYGNDANAILNDDETVSRVTLVRSGSVTHSFDSSQRFIDLEFEQLDQVLTLTVPENYFQVPPGLYMLFVFNESGVPSIAELQMITRDY